MGVRVTTKPNWAGKLESRVKQGLAEMATDIHSRAVILAPVKDSHLKNSGRITSISGGYRITFGSSRVPYARIHELGGVTGRGYRTHIKAKHYLSKAGESVDRSDKSKYFRGKI